VVDLFFNFGAPDAAWSRTVSVLGV
jgi:hypothetical protein